MIRIELTKEQYEQLIAELYSLARYHWNDDRIHANDCGSKVVNVILAQVESK